MFLLVKVVKVEFELSSTLCKSTCIDLTHSRKQAPFVLLTLTS